MDKTARVGIDLAKKVFHVTAVDDKGAVLERKRCGGHSCSRTWHNCRQAAWWRWKRAGARITGRGSRCATSTRHC